MKKYLLFILFVITIYALPNNASAYNGVYSQKTTAYHNAYTPTYNRSYNYNYGYGYGYASDIRAINPYEARHVDYVLAQEKYQKELAAFNAQARAQADAQYARERAQRQQRDEQLYNQLTQQRIAMAASARAQAMANNQATQPVAVNKPIFNPPAAKNTSIVSNADFDLLSNSLEQNTNSNYRRQRPNQVVSMAGDYGDYTSNQPSFFQRLKWALFGRN